MPELIRLTSTVTKNRRLYYLYEISHYLNEHANANYRTIFNYIFNYSNTNHKYFLNLKDPSGEIKSDHAFKRYLALSVDMGLIKKIQNRYTNTIDGIIISTLNKDKKPYELSKQLQIYLLKKIIETDYDYLMTIIKLNNAKNINHLTFRNEIESLLLIEPIVTKNMDIINELNAWKSPNRYFKENIFAPRKAWLIDLDLIHSKLKKNGVFIWKGDRNYLFNRIFTFTKSDFYNYMNNHFYYDCSVFYYSNIEFKSLRNMQFNKKYDIILTILDNIYDRYNIIDRISSKLFFNMCLIDLLTNKQIVGEQEDIKNVLQTMSNETDYRYRPVTEKKSSGELIDTGYITKFS